MIRIATEADVPAILDIYAPYILHSTATFEYDVPSREEFLDRFRSITRQYPWLVWEEGGAVLGYAYAAAPYARAAYAWCAEPSVYLRRDVTGRGIGRRLYAALEEILYLQGYQVLYALITEENTGSLRFHQRCGYEKRVLFPVCGFKSGRWLGVIWMEKRLKSVEIPTGAPVPWPVLRQDAQKFRDILYKLSLS